MIAPFRVKQLTEDQLSLLVHTFKDILVTTDNGIDYLKLYSLRLQVIIPRLRQLENTLTEEGQEVLKGLLITLTSPILPVL